MIREELGSKQGGGSEVVQDMIESGAPMKQILAYTIARVETRAISHALASARWNKKRAAAELGISYKSLLNKIKQYAIEA